MPDGRDVLVVGDVEGCKDFNHVQGDNRHGFQGTCGLVSCQDVLNQFGIMVTENDVVSFAADNSLCHIDDVAEFSGGTTEPRQAEILTRYGVPARPGDFTVDQLSDMVERGHGVIVEVNAGVLWDDARYFDLGLANHAVVMTGVAHDPVTNGIVGVFINDSGTGQSGQFVDSEHWKAACDVWGIGVRSVVTDGVRNFPASSN